MEINAVVKIDGGTALGIIGVAGGSLTINGLTSGSVNINVNAVAGTGINITLPASNGSANQLVSNTGSGIWAYSFVSSANFGTNVLGNANGGTGIDTSKAANGTVLIGNGSGLTLATLTQGSGITIGSASGSITIAATVVPAVGVAKQGAYYSGTNAIGGDAYFTYGGAGGLTLGQSGVQAGQVQCLGSSSSATAIMVAASTTASLELQGNGIKGSLNLSADSTNGASLVVSCLTSGNVGIYAPSTAATLAKTILAAVNVTEITTQPGSTLPVVQDLSGNRSCTAITNAMSATMATMTVKGNVTGGTAAPTDLTAAQLNQISSSGEYKSANQTWANSTVYGPFTHGLGYTPRKLYFTLTCTVAQAGYSVGDIITCYPSNGNTAGTSNITMNVNNGGTTFTAVTGASTMQINNKSTGASTAIVPADWTMNFYAE